MALVAIAADHHLDLSRNGFLVLVAVATLLLVSFTAFGAKTVLARWVVAMSSATIGYSLVSFIALLRTSRKQPGHEA